MTYCHTAVLAILLTVLTGCGVDRPDAAKRGHDPGIAYRYDQPAAPAAGAVRYRADIQPIFERRCVQCHACYDAPCQLKLGSCDGIVRGFSRDSVYSAIRLSEAPLTRLFVDAERASQWRERGFSPVLNEHNPPAKNH